MSAETGIDPHRKAEVAPPYCSDPDCEYCRQLRREMQNQVRALEVLPVTTAREDGL
jgi:hypothetical protein